jgi:hypothetical protein
MDRVMQPARRCRIGLAVDAASLTAALVRDRTVLWSNTAERTACLTEDVRNLLVDVPRHLLFRASVFAVLGPTLAAVKRITGIPPTRDDRELTQLMQGSARRFFLATELGERVAVARFGNDSVWAAGIRAGIIEEIAAGCAAAGLSFRHASPVAFAIAEYVGSGEILLVDGGRSVRVHCADGLPQTIVTRPEEGPPAVDLGDAETRVPAALVPAVAAAVCSLGVARAFRLEPETPDLVPAWRARLAMAACTLALILLAVAPVAAPRANAGRLSAELLAVGEARMAAAQAEQRLLLLASRSHALAEWRKESPSALAILDELTRLLPPESAVVDLRLDTIAGSITLLTTSSADVIRSLEAGIEISSLELAAPITREMSGDREFERLTARIARRIHPAHREATK